MQESIAWLPIPSPWDFPNPGIEPKFLVSPALAGGFFTTSYLGSPLHGVAIRQAPAPARPPRTTPPLIPRAQGLKLESQWEMEELLPPSMQSAEAGKNEL